MMDERTYKKEIVRMWDSLRDDMHKGYDGCNGVKCEECPLNELKRCKNLINYFERNEIVKSCLTINAFETIEAVEKWSKEHQQLFMQIVL